MEVEGISEVEAEVGMQMQLPIVVIIRMMQLVVEDQVVAQR